MTQPNRRVPAKYKEVLGFNSQDRKIAKLGCIHSQSQNSEGERRRMRSLRSARTRRDLFRTKGKKGCRDAKQIRATYSLVLEHQSNAYMDLDCSTEGKRQSREGEGVEEERERERERESGRGREGREGEGKREASRPRGLFIG